MPMGLSKSGNRKKGPDTKKNGAGGHEDKVARTHKKLSKMIIIRR